MARASTHPDAAPTLRRITAITIAALAAMAIAVSAAVVVLTTSLHDANVTLRDTVRSVRVAREAEIQLLLRDRTHDPAERIERERALRATLAELDPRGAAHLDPTLERDAREARALVERYLAATPEGTSRDAAHLDPALAALERIVQADVRTADRAIERGARLDVLGDAIGVATAVLMVAILAFLGLWIRGAVVLPTLTLARVVERFREGDFSVRAPANGAAELRVVMQELNAMADAMAERRKARLTHLAGVAHDLRNPLAALKMSSALIDPSRPSPSEKDMRRAIEVIQRQIGRLNRMVDDLVDAARIEAGQLSLAVQEQDLRERVLSVVELFRDTSRVHDLRVDVGDEPLVVRCDPVRIEQTLTNLVSNAIKYSPRGGTVQLVARRDGDMASVSVSDQGIGIDEPNLPRIWEPFQRTGVSSESIPGVGLGLWTSKRIAEAHHGTLTVESKPAEGSTFTLSLPLAAQPARPRPRTEREEPLVAAAALGSARPRHG